VLADAGSYPTRPGVSGPTIPSGAPVAYPDWAQIASTKDNLLKDYQTVFGD
jgi:iron(III) transport system substrate-binding protein